MKLLLDHNLSTRLTQRLADLYPEAIHVVEVGLERSDDLVIWHYAGLHGLIIVTKDVDFTELSIIRSGSPKVIWIRRGNCSTSDIEQILRDSYSAIERFAKSDGQVLEIG